MNLVQFIKKYSLYKTFYVNELNPFQLKELESCVEFSNVKKFNIVNHKDNFFINNSIDFPIIKLMTNTKFSYKLNLLSISVIGPFPTHDVYQMKNGLTSFKYVSEDNFKEYGAITYKFNLEELHDKFLSSEEIKKYLKEEFLKGFDESSKQDYYYLIGIRAHKDSVSDSKGNGEDIKIPVEFSNDSILF